MNHPGDSLSFTFARIRGTPIRAHVSLALVFFVFISPALGMTRPETTGFSRSGLVLWSLAAAVVFIVSILLHELGHVFQGKREKMEVHGVTLWALGGFAQLSGGTPSPGRDFRVAAAGPLVTALLALILSGLPLVVAEGGTGAATPVWRVLDFVGRAQIFLLGFNLVPAYPLDGGRMFLAALWRIRNNLTRAAETAAAVGKAFGIFLMVLGALGLFARQLAALLPTAFRVNSVTGLLIGYLIFSANRSPLGLLHHDQPPGPRRGREGMIVADFMNRDFVIAAPEMTISDLLDALGRLQVRPVALVIKDGRPLGMISRQRAEQVPETERETKKIADVMVRKQEIRTVKANDSLPVARSALENGPETAVVLNNDVVVGLVSVSDVARAMVSDQR